MIENQRLVRDKLIDSGYVIEVSKDDFLNYLVRSAMASYIPMSVLGCAVELYKHGEQPLAILPALVGSLMVKQYIEACIRANHDLSKLSDFDLLTDLKNFEVDPETIESRPGGRKWHQTS